MGVERVSDDAVVGMQKFLSSGIAEALSEGRGALHVGEEDGDEAGRGGPRRSRLAFAQELVDGFQHCLRVAQVRSSGCPLQQGQAGVWNAGGKAPGDARIRYTNLASVKHQRWRLHLRQEGHCVKT